MRRVTGVDLRTRMLLLGVVTLAMSWAAVRLRPMTPVIATAAAAMAGPMPREVVVEVGQTTTVRIEVRGVTDLYGADVRLAFDPTYVEVVDADPGTPGVQLSLRSDFLAPDWVLRNVADNQDGTIWYAATQMSPSPPVTGTGVLADITFRGLTAGTTPIAVSYVELARGNGTTMDSTGESGRIIVTLAGLTATPGATPTRRPTTVRSPTPSPTDESTEAPPRTSPTATTALTRTITPVATGTATSTVRPVGPTKIYLPYTRKTPGRRATLLGVVSSRNAVPGPHRVHVRPNALACGG